MKIEQKESCNQTAERYQTCFPETSGAQALESSEQEIRLFNGVFLSVIEFKFL